GKDGGHGSHDASPRMTVWMRSMASTCALWVRCRESMVVSLWGAAHRRRWAAAEMLSAGCVYDAPGTCRGGGTAEAGGRTLAARSAPFPGAHSGARSEEHTSELQSRGHLVCRLLLEKKKQTEQDNRMAAPAANWVSTGFV